MAPRHMYAGEPANLWSLEDLWNQRVQRKIAERHAQNSAQRRAQWMANFVEYGGSMDLFVHCRFFSYSTNVAAFTSVKLPLNAQLFEAGLDQR
ncbi:hypothetical protein JCM10207_008266 [Rhodosporidiobolus poonsookiae]